MIAGPTWADVGVPSALLYSVKTLPACGFLDRLVHRLVFRQQQRPSFTYTCDFCGFIWRPERASEEVSCCLQCRRSRIRAAPRLGYAKSVPPYTRRVTWLDNVWPKLAEHYAYYFGEVPSPLIDVGWDRGVGYAQLVSGERVSDVSPRMCLVRAMLLTPFLWDRSFDWNSAKGTDNVNVEHLSPVLAQLVNME